MSLNANALATVEEVKDFLHIDSTSDDDALIEQLINRVSAQVETFTNRIFVETTYREWKNGGGDTIGLKHYPVTAVSRIATGSETMLTVKGSTSTDLRATVEAQDSLIRLSRFDSAGTETASTLAFSTYPTISDLVTAINAISGWTATLTKNGISLDLHRLGGEDALGRDVELTAPDTSDVSYKVDESNGLIRFTDGHDWSAGNDHAAYPRLSRQSRRGFQRILVQYTAGYVGVTGSGGAAASTIPADLRSAAIEIIGRLYQDGLVDPTVGSETLGDYSYSGTGTSTDLDDAARRKLAPFRSVPL